MKKIELTCSLLLQISELGPRTGNILPRTAREINSSICLVTECLGRNSQCNRLSAILSYLYMHCQHNFIYMYSLVQCAAKYFSLSRPKILIVQFAYLACENGMEICVGMYSPLLGNHLLGTMQLHTGIQRFSRREGRSIFYPNLLSVV